MLNADDLAIVSVPRSTRSQRLLRAANFERSGSVSKTVVTWHVSQNVATQVANGGR